MIISKSLSRSLPGVSIKVLDSTFSTNPFLAIKAYKVTQSYMQTIDSNEISQTSRDLKKEIDLNSVHVNESLKLLYELAREESSRYCLKSNETE